MSELFEITAGKMINGGYCLAKALNTTLFVKYALPGEKVLVKIIANKKNFSFAQTVKVIDSSPYRIDHIWGEADPLKKELVPGGADLGYIQLSQQRYYKTLIVKEILNKIAHISLPECFVVESVEDGGVDSGLGWRTRMRYAIDSKNRLAMFESGSDKTVSIDSMPLATTKIGDLNLSQYSWEGFREIRIFSPTSGDTNMLIVDPRERKVSVQDMRKRLSELPKEIFNIGYYRTNGTIEYIRGNSFVEERKVVGKGKTNFSWRITGDSFWQIHRNAPTVLAEKIVDLAQINPSDTIWDLYSGVGLFARYCVEKLGSSGVVCAVESSKKASLDSLHNLKNFSNIKIVGGKVSEVLDTLPSDPNTIILDPPRSGSNKQILNRIIAASPERIIYVSCDPATLARDVSYMREHNWGVKQFFAYDIYPNTPHVECVALLFPQ